jgi:Mg2+-importing ATPase
MPAWWSREARDVAAELKTDVARGLSSHEAAARLATVGPNVLEAAKRTSVIAAFVSQLRSPLVLLLVIAAVVSAAVREWTDAAVVVAIVLGSAILGTFHEWRASTAVEKLRASVRIRTTVVRDGSDRQIPAADIVPGDLVRLAAGSLVPGDAILAEAKDLFVGEALLTGESFPVEKETTPSASDASIAKRRNAVFLGSTVRSGTALAIIVGTGPRTELGAIAHTLALRAPETAFEAGLRRFGLLLMRVMIVLTLLVVTVNVIGDRPPVDALLFAIALAVGISPELLPAILSVTLSRGAMRMAERGVIVKRLSVIESFGAMDVLCTDKTGTLTEGVVELDGALDPYGDKSDEVLLLAGFNAELETGMPSPLDDAILRATRAAGLDTHAPKLDEVPYDFSRKRVGIVLSRSGAPLLVVKGALTSVLDACTTVRKKTGDVAVQTERAAICARANDWNEKGFRVLGVATRRVEPKDRYDLEDEHGLVFEGLLVFFDPPKAGAAEVVRSLGRLGVALKIVTGDTRGVAVHVARMLQIPIEGVLTGAELAKLHGGALLHAVEHTTIFAEVDPSQKERVIVALRSRGHVVGYVGDGINDAPALHAADVSISVEGAADVAKEAADIVLGRRDLDVLRAGVEAGRMTFANTLKYVYTTTSANFGNMISMAVASIWLPFLPLSATQILLNNFLSDVPQTFIAGDAVDEEKTARPERWDVASIRDFMLVFGLVSSTFDLLTFGVLLLMHASVDEFRTAWFVESLLTELGIAFVVRTARPFWKSRPSTAFMAASISIAAVALGLPYSPLGRIFGLVPLEARWVALLIGITAAYLATSEGAKWVWQRRRASKRAKTEQPTDEHTNELRVAAAK